MRQTDLQLPDEFLWPTYNGRCIANVPATVASLLNAEFEGLPPLAEGLWKPFSSGAKRVVILLLDAFGWNLLQAEQPRLAHLLNKADCVETIQSIFPSTTAAALSSVWTGVGAAQHGLLGLNLFFPEQGAVGQTLAFTPAFGHYPDALIEAGVKPDSFLQWPGLAQQLASYGIPTYTFKDRKIVHSALSKMHGRGVAQDHGVLSFNDMLTQMGQLLEERSDEPLYMWAYWDVIDILSHYRLWDAPATRAEIVSLFQQIETSFLNVLSEKAKQDTLFFIMADHGQIALPRHIFIDDYPLLQEALFMKPTGDPRVSYLYAKHGREQQMLDTIKQQLSHAIFAMSAEEALAAGLFGPEPHTAVASERLGDIVAIMREDYVLITRDLEKKAKRLKGGHGSLTAGEMQVPWIGIRLDGW